MKMYTETGSGLKVLAELAQIQNTTCCYTSAYADVLQATKCFNRMISITTDNGTCDNDMEMLTFLNMLWSDLGTLFDDLADRQGWQKTGSYTGLEQAALSLYHTLDKTQLPSPEQFCFHEAQRDCRIMLSHLNELIGCNQPPEKYPFEYVHQVAYLNVMLVELVEVYNVIATEQQARQKDAPQEAHNAAVAAPDKH